MRKAWFWHRIRISRGRNLVVCFLLFVALPLRLLSHVETKYYTPSASLRVKTVVIISRGCPPRLQRFGKGIRPRFIVYGAPAALSCTVEDVEFVRCGSLDCPASIVKRFAPSEEEEDIRFCIDCPEALVAALRSPGFQVIALPASDFSQMVWLEHLSSSEIALWSRVTFEINIISTCRMRSLGSLLEALTKSHFFGDRVDMTIALDVHPSKDCLELLQAFRWKHGNFRLSRRIKPAGGPQVAVPEGVTATVKEHSLAILLEDDVLVSTQFYSWLKFVGLQLAQYRRKIAENTKLKIFSISLYTPRVVETGGDRRLKINFKSHGLETGNVFLYEVPCSWGSAFLGSYWSDALTYFEARLRGEVVYAPIDGSRVNGWTGSWKKWLIELGHYEHWVTVYPYFTNQTSFSTNLLMKGEHITEMPSAEELQMYKVPIFTNTSWYYQLRTKRLFPIDDAFDLFFHEI